MSKKYILLKYFLGYLFIGLAIGSYFPVLTFYLDNELLLTGTELGIITSFTTIIPIMFLPLWGIITDTIKSPKKTLIIVLLFSAIFIFIISSINSFLLFFIIFILFNLFRVPIFSLYDEMIVSVCKEYNISYGIFRAGCSLGVSISSFIGLKIGEALNNYSIIFVFASIFFIIVFIILLSIKDVKHHDKEQFSVKEDLPILFKNKFYLILALVMAITYGVLDSNFSYMSNYLKEMGGKEYISLAIFLSVFIEIFILYFSKFLYRKLSFKTIILAVNIITIFRYLMIFLFPSYLTILIVAPLHGITFGFTYPIAIQLISENVPKRVLSSAYTFYGALIALFTASISYFTGLISGKNTLGIFILFIILSVINTIIISLFLKKVYYKPTTNLEKS